MGSAPGFASPSAQRIEKATSRARLWPSVALLPVLIVGSLLKPAGITMFLGVDLTVLSLVILLLATVVQFSRYPRYPLKEMMPFLLFAVAVLLGVTMSEPGQYQATKARDFFSLTGVVIACIPVLLRDTRDLRGLVLTWLLAGSITSSAVLIVGGADNLFGRAGIGEDTLGPAYLAAPGLVAAVCCWGERMLRWHYAIALVGLNGLALVTIGSRGPMLSAFVGVAAWALLSGVFRGRTAVAGLLLLGGVLLGASAASEQSLARLFIYSDPAREELWTIGTSVLQESPILGLGWGDYSTIGFLPYPHNAFVEAGVELGVIGFLAFCGVLVTAGARTWRSRDTAEARVLGALATTMLVGQQLSSDLTNRVFWIALVPTLLLVKLSARESTGIVPLAARSRWAKAP